MPQNQSSKPLILLTNDDGFDSPGLLALNQALREVGEVVVIAPEHNWSAAGHSKTMHKPLRVRRGVLTDGTEVQVTSGSPSDCVALALLGLLERKPDLVVSGINLGANVSHDLTYSGTVAAAMEATIAGITGIAVSLDTFEVAIYEPAARFVARLITQIPREALDMPLLLNVNVPALPAEQIKGVQVTRLGHRLYRDALVERLDPRGRTYYWIGGEPPEGVPEEGTDIGALAEGYVSITPVLLDLTDSRRLELLRSWNLHL
ncbi:MAG: 5'/3'-nucleotidase SurE [Chloroflexi bacterium]|jgi:5'-nucleotidase|nr:5'/3'-nucleotidase SurE [Chloroflexota bacterium]